MTDNELLLAISGLLDKKLKPLEERMESLDEKVERVDRRERKVEERLDKLEKRFDNLEGRVGKLERDLAEIKYNQEKVIIPRLNTIEACYTGTFNRYKMYVEKMQAAFEDIEMLKVVVADHSEKLAKLA